MFGNVFWRVVEADATHLVLTHVSPDGDQGFSGTLEVRATWWIEGATLWLELEARTNEATIVNLSAHPYFNLRRVGREDFPSVESRPEETYRQRIGHTFSISGPDRPTA